MPMIDRRPNLASLVVPSPGPLLKEDIRTPLPHTPMVSTPITAAPMVMTPDTPCFSFPTIESTLASAGQNDTDLVWSEAQDDLIQSYLTHPPRQLNNAYPPDSLPPPGAIEELSHQLLRHPEWPSSHGLVPTRARVLELARKNVTEYHQGPKREYVPIMPPAGARAIAGASNSQATGMGPSLARRAMRPKLTVGAAGPGSLSMNRQADSMDSLYGDAEPGTFSEALRLSSTLQDTASSGANELSSVGALSSPLEFTFTFNPTQPSAVAPQSAATPFAHVMRAPRPTSLLQRGRSFTGHDLASIPSTIDEAMSADLIPEDEQETLNNACDTKPDQAFRDASTGHGHVKHDRMTSEPSSPVSSITMSPPSSINSSIDEEEMPSLTSTSSIAESSIDAVTTTTLIKGFGSLEVEPEPFTPLNSTFFPINTPLNPQHSLTPISPKTASATTPAITLTIESPLSGSIPTPRNGTKDSEGDTTMSSPTSTARAFANLSLSNRRVPPGAPGPSRKPRQSAPGGIGLSRSLSDGIAGSAFNHQFSISRLAKTEAGSSNAERAERGHSLARPMIKRQRGNMPELSVFVPRPGGKNWVDELRSPFEHKPAGSGAGAGPNGAQGVSI